ncbi:MAG: cation:proton antiporter domain-containing protein [Pseudobacter sp.]|uniref:cation:proton antiporter domain-containing protein n=1 Tax=Pseudobacter sp. TaxID=2045420 RepID=UPI003F7D59EC
MENLLYASGIMCLVILLLIFLLKKLNQPYLIAYILAGLLLGPHVSGVFRDPESIEHIGEIGILLLMFFLGMEINIPDRKSLLLKPLIAQGAKTIVSFALSALICHFMQWPVQVLVLLTAFLTFNSTAVASELMRKNGQIRTVFGSVVLNMLLLQDILLAPAITSFQLMGSSAIHPGKFIGAALGSILLFFLLRSIRNRDLFQFPFIRAFDKDHELQVFAGAIICLGFAMLADLAGLSGPIGSFAAGLLIGRTQAFAWLEQVMHPFKVFFVALFFMSVGIRLDLDFVTDHYLLVLTLTTMIMVIHSFTTALVFRLLRFPWKHSLYAGALLSQSGEFGILICAIAYNTGLIDETFYKTGLAVTALSLLLTTFWEKLYGILLDNKRTTALI